MQLYPSRTNVPDETVFRVRLLGANNAHPTKEFGPGVTVTRTGEGAYLATFAGNPGVFVGLGSYVFGAATPGDMAGYTLSVDTPYSTTAGVYTLPFVVYNSSFAAADIIAAQYLYISFVFKTTAV